MFLAIVPASLLVLLATRFSAFLGLQDGNSSVCSSFYDDASGPEPEVQPLHAGICFLFFPMVCFSLSAIPIINCLWSQFPRDLNKVSGAAIHFFSLGMITWNILFFKIVNPNNLKAQIDTQNQPYFGT